MGNLDVLKRGKGPNNRGGETGLNKVVAGMRNNLIFFFFFFFALVSEDFNLWHSLSPPRPVESPLKRYL